MDPKLISNTVRYSLAGVVLCAAVLVSPASAQIRKFEPFDEASRDPSFLIFRDKLMAAVQEHDSAHVDAVLAGNILNSFGGDGGIEEFWQMWSVASVRDLWGTLGTVLAHGGVFHGDTMFVAPYVFAGWPRGFDPIAHGVILGQDVRVRSEPDVTSSILATLSYELVEARVLSRFDDGSGARFRWVPVQLADGTEGYVADRYFWSAMHYRASFVKRDDRWLMRSLVAGD